MLLSRKGVMQLKVVTMEELHSDDKSTQTADKGVQASIKAIKLPS